MTPEETTALPSQANIDKLLALQVKSSDGQPVAFRTLLNDSAHPRVLTIFIRHFFCGFCEQYVQALAKDLPPPTLAALSPSTKLVVIGCGDPSLIKDYAARTSSPYEIYADPSRSTYDALGFCVTLAGGNKVPTYSSAPLLTTIWGSFVNNLSAGTKIFSGGKTSQNGGELVWENGELKSIHRMAGTTDHMAVEDLKKQIEL